jgi:hypothetical protein
VLAVDAVMDDMYSVRWYVQIFYERACEVRTDGNQFVAEKVWEPPIDCCTNLDVPSFERRIRVDSRNQWLFVDVAEKEKVRGK